VADALKRIITASRTVAVFAVVVDAADTAAASFYAQMGYAPTPGAPLRLTLPLATAVRAVSLTRDD